MAVSYKKLFHLLIEKRCSNSLDLQNQAKVFWLIIITTYLKELNYITLQSIEAICKVYLIVE